jgi:hypothetical protein
MKRCVLATLMIAFGVFVLPGSAQAADWGDISGQFVFEGDIPAKVIQFKKGDPASKDPAICAATDMFKQDLVIDKESKGVANIFIYMRKTKAIHPDLKSSKDKEIVFDQKGCQFKPHSLFVRTDQTVLVKSDDPISHNTHTYTIKNKPVNFIIPGVNRKGIPVKVPLSEILPMEVKCDVHPWMKAHWLILNHPYATVSAKDGKFKIEKLPAGEQEFRIWHERVGYIDRKFKVNVAAGKETKLDPMKLDINKLTSDD